MDRQSVPIVSIVTGTYNRIEALKKMMASAYTAIPFGFTYEFIIVDGGSTDGTQEWLQSVPHVTLIQHTELVGAIIAFCEGAYRARGKYVLMANDDVTFHPGSIFKAVIHLEKNMTCGAVAFADNRPVKSKRPGETAVQFMPAQTPHPQRPWVVYAQVGLFRRWLGDVCNWWGMDRNGKKLIGARTYGGDNFLSARIWEQGYSVEAVEGVSVHDDILEDELRQTNREILDRGYHDIYPKGPRIASQPLLAQKDKESVRILYLPIYENHAIQKDQKKGLREALSKNNFVIELDYSNHNNPLQFCGEAVEVFNPHLILTQFHGADDKTLPLLRLFRMRSPQSIVVNWNGDYWPHGLTTPDVLEMLKLVDLQLVVNATVLDTYAQHGIPAAYWQIGYEEPDPPYPDMPEYDIVFLANNYSNERLELGQFLKSLPFKVGIYGGGWNDLADGECLYDFAKGQALYNNAKIAIGDNQFTDADGYVSNRIFQALSAGGAMLIHQHVKNLEQHTGLVLGAHYIGWKDLDDLATQLHLFLNPDFQEDRQRIAEAGTQYVRAHHSFDERVKQLWQLIDHHASRDIGGTIKVILPGAISSGGVRGKATGKQYYNTPGKPLVVDARDGKILLNEGWEQVK